MNRLNIYQGYGLPTKFRKPKGWIKCRKATGTDILQHPPLPDKIMYKRKTMDANRSLITID